MAATAVGTMTDRPQTTARPPSPAPPKAPTAGEPPRRRAARRHGRATPIRCWARSRSSVMTLATFLVLFTLMMARLRAGVDPALRASTSTSLVAASSGDGRRDDAHKWRRRIGCHRHAGRGLRRIVGDDRPPSSPAPAVHPARRRSAMSDAPPTRTPAREPRSRGALGVLWAAAAVFLALLALLALRVAAARIPRCAPARPPRPCLPAASWSAACTNGG